MKKILLILSALFSLSVAAQDVRPLLVDGKKWVVSWENFFIDHSLFEFFTIKGTTELDGYQWYNVYRDVYHCSEWKLEVSDEPFQLMREADGALYAYRSDAPGGVLLFDFRSKAGAELPIWGNDYWEGFSPMDSIFVREECVVENRGERYHGIVVERRRQDYFFDISSRYSSSVWVEGIGNLYYGLWSWMMPEGIVDNFDRKLVEVVEDGKTIYFDLPWEFTEEQYIAVGLASPASASPASLRLFDLQGRRLSAEPQRGMFVRGGQKVMK